MLNTRRERYPRLYFVSFCVGRQEILDAVISPDATALAVANAKGNVSFYVIGDEGEEWLFPFRKRACSSWCDWSIDPKFCKDPWWICRVKV